MSKMNLIDKNAPASTSTGKVRRWLISIAALVVAGKVSIAAFHTVVMQPYAVIDGGRCGFEVQPTGWNGGHELPCGSLTTYFSVPVEVYFANR